MLNDKGGRANGAGFGKGIMSLLVTLVLTLGAPITALGLYDRRRRSSGGPRTVTHKIDRAVIKYGMPDIGCVW